MKKCLLAVLSLVMIMSLPIVADDSDYPYEVHTWYPGIIHLHSTYSDGLRSMKDNVAKAKNLGLKFVCFTEHAKYMGKEEDFSGRLTTRYERYKAEARSFDKPDQFAVFSSLEVSAKWHAEADTTDTADTIGIKFEIPHWDPVIASLDHQEGTQAKIIKRLNSLSCLPVAAHPTLIVTKSLKAKPWEWTRMRYDRRDPSAYEGIKGIEFFNCATNGQNQEIVSWYLSLIKEGKDIFVTSGCDSHGFASTNSFDSENWQKVTWVRSTLLNTECLYWGIQQGRTYAACKGFRLTNASHWPCFKPQDVNSVNLTFTVECPKGSQRVTYNLFRDGIINGEGQRSCQNGLIEFQLKDNDATRGIHRYVFEIENRLITSPIVLNVR